MNRILISPYVGPPVPYTGMLSQRDIYQALTARGEGSRLLMLFDGEGFYGEGEVHTVTVKDAIRLSMTSGLHRHLSEIRHSAQHLFEEMACPGCD